LTNLFNPLKKKKLLLHYPLYILVEYYHNYSKIILLELFIIIKIFFYNLCRRLMNMNASNCCKNIEDLDSV